MTVHDVETIRTGNAPPYQGGRIYECDPAAVARLKRLVAEQRQAKEAAEAARLARQNDDAARLVAAAKRRKEAPAPAPAPRKQRSDAHRFTSEQLAAAVETHAGGRFWRHIAADLGTDRSTLRRALAIAGYDIHSQPRWVGRLSRYSDDEIRAIYARQRAGESLRALAAEYGVPPPSLNRRFRRLGLPAMRYLQVK